MFSNTEFWSAIVGALVGAVAGGLIAYLIQRQALAENRKQREEDHKRTQQGLAHSLLIKMIRVLTGFHGVHRHVEDCFQEAARNGHQGEPWTFVLPLANPPDAVHFSAEEMGMLFALKDDETFNAVISTDVVHNSLMEAVRVLNAKRSELAGRLTPQMAQGRVLVGFLEPAEMLALRPLMIEVNSLIEKIRDWSRDDLLRANEALDKLSQLFREKLELRQKLKLKVELPTFSKAAPAAS